MNLQYRGISYQRQQSAIEMAESGTTGRYRGAVLKLRTPQHPIAQKECGTTLKYRGVVIH